MLERQTDRELEVIAGRGCLRQLLDDGELTCNRVIGQHAQRFGEDDEQLTNMITCDPCAAELEMLRRSLDHV